LLPNPNLFLGKRRGRPLAVFMGPTGMCAKALALKTIWASHRLVIVLRHTTTGPSSTARPSVRQTETLVAAQARQSPRCFVVPLPA